MRRLALVLLLGIGLSACLHLPARHSPPAGGTRTTPAPIAGDKVRVFVFTAPSTERLGTIEQRDREVATRDVERRLRTKRRIALVDSREQADVVVEVLSAVNTFSPAIDTRFNPHSLSANVTIGGRTTRLDESRSTTKRSSFKLGDRIETWIEGHRAELRRK